MNARDNDDIVWSGRFRILHPTFEEAIIAFIIGVLFETNGDPSAVPVAEYTDMLSLYPAPLVVHCLLSLSAADEALQAVKAAAEGREVCNFSVVMSF